MALKLTPDQARALGVAVPSSGRTRARRPQANLADTLYAQLRIAGCALPKREYRFCQTRRWRFDLAYPHLGLGIEVDGGVHTMATSDQGRHTRGSGFEKDCAKLNAAAMLGWRVLRFTSKMVRTQEAVTLVRLALAGMPRE